MKKNGIKHIRSAPGHPATNGEAERFVQTFKRALKTGKKYGGSLQTRLSWFLFVYRTTPHATTGVSPAELFVKRQLRTHLDLLHPANQTKVNAQQANQKKYHDQHSRHRQFEVGQSVLAKNLRGEPHWLPGKVIERTGPVSYRVEVRDKIWRRHTDQLLATGVQVSDTPPEDNVNIHVDWPQISEPVIEPSDNTCDTPTPTESNSPVTSPEESSNSPTDRYPRRDRKQTERLIYKY